MVAPSGLQPILSRPTSTDGLGPEGLRVEVVADLKERSDLARLNQIPEVLSLEASFLLRPEGRNGVWVTGEVRARVVQTSVVTLEPFEAEVAESVDLHLLPEAALEAHLEARAKRARDPSEPEDESDVPDLLVDDRIDLGALAAEHLTLGLDPYPKKPGEAFVAPTTADQEPEVSPFAILKALKTDKA
jgi:hypothetical protein